MGSVSRNLKVAGERELIGHGVSTSAKRDGARFSGRDVAVIGDGEAALEEALHLAPIAGHVTLIQRRLRLRPPTVAVTRLRSYPNVAILTATEVPAVQGGQHVTGLRIRDRHHGGEPSLASGCAAALDAERWLNRTTPAH
ncbi:NAD-binding protein [Mycobacterium sp. 1423905.2]|uniref:NAD(P)/FAD-dependent oxidoreductase n=1 Tax=Mycobacterium sp. 1423905.2 TaxID=1856859 RepID=UPI0009F672A5